MTFIKNKRKKSNLSNINILKITNNTNLQPVEEENTNSKVNKGIKNNLESGPIEVEDVSALFIKKGKGKGKISAREITKSQELGNNQKYIKSTQIYDKLKKINLIEIENNFKKIFKQNDFLTKKIDFLMKQDKIKTEKIKSLEKEVLNLKKTNKQL
ncbi:hypothetical protein M0812_00990 [Anaeramoeba flamelloides]|uniref:Uncharacterized protein n=1 Tax=Anaeramoeba flamelloides TaxID=1746091 RepID=A0AAV8A926_9EUKA|nr:hypothetical protein M0812_00990 [Anaeramoeba flamelloides]